MGRECWILDLEGTPEMEVAQIPHFAYEKTESVTCPRFPIALPSVYAPKQATYRVLYSIVAIQKWQIFFFLSLRIVLSRKEDK